MRGLSAERATQRSRPRDQRVLRGPALLGRTRRDIAELIGWVWLTIEVSRLVRSRLGERSPVSRPERMP